MARWDTLSMDRPIIIYFERGDVDALRTAAPAAALGKMAISALTAREYADRLQLVFDGFELSERRVYEVPAVCQFMRELTLKFPYWTHFCSRSDDCLWLVMQCLLRSGGGLFPFGTETAPGAAGREDLDRLADWLLTRMNHLYATIGMTAAEAAEMTTKVRRYLQDRRPDAL